MDKLKIGAVSYLNTKPLIYGLESGLMAEKVKLVMDYPAKIAMSLLNDQIDIGLIPVAVIPKLSEHYIISDFCIGAEGKVASVCLFSEVPVNEIKRILLDYQSRTSVALLKILIKEYWKIDPEFLSTSDNFQSLISGKTAGLVIGDRALLQRKRSTFIYDLAEAWIDHTGLPFVFAAWVSNKPISNAFMKEFNESNYFGLQQIPKIVSMNPFESYDLLTYYTENISYDLNEVKKKGLSLFLSKLPLSSIV